MIRGKTQGPEETMALGRALGARLLPGDVVALLGDLGSGKTRFVTGACQALGVRVAVASPTFTLINEYPAPFGTVVHIDLYRIHTRRELAELGVEEYFGGETVCFIEWPELLEEFLPERHYRVRLSHGSSEGEREIDVHEPGEAAS